MSSHPTITTRDIVTVAILSSLGGTLSTFVGYLGNLINLSLGVPFGAGQFMAGLHVFWIVLIRILVPKQGVGTAGGLLKGTIEMFTGSTHGVAIVVVSLVQGLIIDAGATLAGKTDPYESRLVWWISAGISSAANVIVLQILYFGGGAPWYILYVSIMLLLAFSSGVIFAGYFAWQALDFLIDANVISTSMKRDTNRLNHRRGVSRRNLPGIAIILFLVVGSIYYTTSIVNVFGNPNTCEVRGLVENPFTFTLDDFANQQVTIEAELIGSYTHLEPANYTGPLVSTILSAAHPLPGSSGLRVIARDGYTVEFDDLSAVLADTRLLLTDGGDGLWLIAAEYDGALWVRQVSILEVF